METTNNSAAVKVPTPAHDEPVTGTKDRYFSKNRYVAGIAPKSDVLLAKPLLKHTQAQLIDFGVQRSQMEHAIALLIGKPPADFSLPATSSAITIPLGPKTHSRRFACKGFRRRMKFINA